jgi:hypothetical protein
MLYSYPPVSVPRKAALSTTVSPATISSSMSNCRDGRPFGGCTCELALMDIDDLAGALSTVTAVLRPGGWFVASMVHPCFPGTELGRSSWRPAEGYASEGWWISPDHNPGGVRIRAGSRTVR